MPPEAIRPELSRPLPLGLVGPGGRLDVVTASPAECDALAARFGILGIAACRATLRLTPDPDGAVRAQGRLEAAVTQACVVSCEPVEQTVDVPVAFRFLPAGRVAEEAPDAIDEIETEHDIADLGEAVAEALALALDPLPRAPEAVLPPEAADASAGAFAGLAELRRPN